MWQIDLSGVDGGGIGKGMGGQKEVKNNYLVEKCNEF
jgi:hypothetical protein